jgi:prepilin-type N-terminal cleavage/methylation domain-containing protein
MKHANQQGFSLAELLVAVAIFLVGIVGIGKFFTSIRVGTAMASNDTAAALMAKNLLEMLRSKKWDASSANVMTGPPSYVAAASRSPIGPDGAETALPQASRLILFDDIDDFHNYTDRPNEVFTRSVEVKYVVVSPVTGGDVTDSPGGAVTDFKLVRIKVSWTDKTEHSQTIQAVMANGV